MVFKETTNSIKLRCQVGAVLRGCVRPPREALIAAPRGNVNVGEHDETAFELYDTAPQTDVRIFVASLYRARPGPHDWGSSWKGLTQTRPALLPYARALRERGSEKPRTRGFRVPTGGGTDSRGLSCSQRGLPCLIAVSVLSGSHISTRFIFAKKR